MYRGPLTSWMCAALLLVAVPIAGAEAVDSPGNVEAGGTDAIQADAAPERDSPPTNTSIPPETLDEPGDAPVDGPGLPVNDVAGSSGPPVASGPGAQGASGPGPSSTGIVTSVQAEVLGAPGWLVGLSATLVGLLATVRLRSRGTRPPGTPDDRPPDAPDAGSTAQDQAVRFEPVADTRRALEHPGPSGAMLLGQQALQEDRPELASGWFAIATRLAPSLEVAHLCLGLALREAGRSEEAVAALSQAVELDDTDARARLNLARALVEAGRDSDAIDALTPLAGAAPTVDERLAQDPAFAPLRDHPRFLALLGQLNL